MSIAFLFWITFAGGLLAGVLATLAHSKLTSKRGYLLIDESDPDKPIWRIDLNNLLDDNTKKFILEIKRDVDLSQK